MKRGNMKIESTFKIDTTNNSVQTTKY